MPIPKTPTAILERRGSFDRNPQRRPKAEPKPRGKIGDPPEHFNAAEVDCWNEIIQYSPRGVLTSADRFHLEQAARFLANLRAKAKGRKALTGGEIKSFVTLFGLMGLNPSDRSKVSVIDPGGEDAIAAAVESCFN